jgi:hypothetical protein
VSLERAAATEERAVSLEWAAMRERAAPQVQVALAVQAVKPARVV